MLREAHEAPGIVRRLLTADLPNLTALSEGLRRSPPALAITLARGSSDAAAAWFAYMAAARLGLVTASLPPSLVTLEAAALRVERALLVAVSQSGRSPDLVLPMQTLAGRAQAALALVNDPASPLAQAAPCVVDLGCGPERAVAATKSFIASVAALARLIATLDPDGRLRDALADLPGRLEAARALDWSAALTMLTPAQRLFVIARGPGLPIAQEMALKLKELCGIHAEALSAAEVLHGPKAILGPGDPVLLLAPEGTAGDSVRATALSLGRQGIAPVVIGRADGPGLVLKLPPSLHPALDPLLAVQAFYGFTAALARARGLDPDQPPHLTKVTLTR
jgi:glucosamine--fructose-6-phosphate aminotransferase (isomerizing)